MTVQEMRTTLTERVYKEICRCGQGGEAEGWANALKNFLEATKSEPPTYTYTPLSGTYKYYHTQPLSYDETFTGTPE